MPDSNAILQFLRDPNLQTGPYPQWPTLPPLPYRGPELRNPGPRPQEATAPVSEALSPTMGGYGMGQIAADTLMKAQQGDYAGVAANAPFIIGALKNPVRIDKPIKPVFHGSPHDFKPEPGYPLGRFDLEKVGTGEGAQAYGHGLYFAESEPVAKTYRDQLASVSGPISRVYDASGKELTAKDFESGPNFQAWNALSSWGDYPRAEQFIKERFMRTPATTETLEALQRLKDAGVRVEPRGHMYEVALHATPESFLDWDKPLNQQSQVVQDALKGAIKHPTEAGDYAYYWPTQNEKNIQAAREAGIPGVRYLDQQSRNPVVADPWRSMFRREDAPLPKATHNYSVWSPEIIEILRKYGIIAAPTAAATANALSQPQQNQQQ